MKKLILALVVVLSLAVPFAASAQNALPNPIVITEDQINSAFAVTNPLGRRWSNLSVDLQSGQAVINGEYTMRRPPGRGTTTVDVSAVVTVTVENGRLYSTVQSATVDGSAAPPELLTQINNALMSAWRNYLRRDAPAGRITSVTIDANSVQIGWQ